MKSLFIIFVTAIALFFAFSSCCSNSKSAVSSQETYEILSLVSAEMNLLNADADNTVRYNIFDGTESASITHKVSVKEDMGGNYFWDIVKCGHIIYKNRLMITIFYQDQNGKPIITIEPLCSILKGSHAQEEAHYLTYNVFNNVSMGFDEALRGNESYITTNDVTIKTGKSTSGYYITVSR